MELTGALDHALVRAAACLAVAGLCGWACDASRNAPGPAGQRAVAHLWIALGALFLALAAAHLLDAGHLLTDFGRSEARTEGWYAARRPVQAAVIMALAAGVLLAAATTAWRLPARFRPALPALLVTLALITFLLVRAISLHAVDQRLNRHLAGELHTGAAIELALTALAAGTIAAAAIRAEHTRARLVSSD